MRADLFVLPLTLALGAGVFGSARAQLGIPTGNGTWGGMGQLRPGAGPQGNGVRFQIVARGDRANSRAGFVRITDAPTLLSYWRQASLSGPMPRFVDWTNDQILVIHLDQRPTDGYAVLPSTITKSLNGRGQILAVEQTPIPGQSVAQTVTNPYVVLAVDRMVTEFDLVWTRRTRGGIASVPPGTIVDPATGLFLFPPLPDYGYGWFGGDYECLVTDPGQYWIDGDASLLNYNVSVLANRTAIAPRFDWRRERLLAVHLGTRETAVAIETVGYERTGDRAVLTLREVPAPTARFRDRRTLSPFALLRVDRRVKNVEVKWAKGPG